MCRGIKGYRRISSMCRDTSGCILQGFVVTVQSLNRGFRAIFGGDIAPMMAQQIGRTCKRNGH